MNRHIQSFTQFINEARLSTPHDLRQQHIMNVIKVLGFKFLKKYRFFGTDIGETPVDEDGYEIEDAEPSEDDQVVDLYMCVDSSNKPRAIIKYNPRTNHNGIHIVSEETLNVGKIFNIKDETRDYRMILRPTGSYINLPTWIKDSVIKFEVTPLTTDDPDYPNDSPKIDFKDYLRKAFNPIERYSVISASIIQDGNASMIKSQILSIDRLEMLQPVKQLKLWGFEVTKFLQPRADSHEVIELFIPGKNVTMRNGTQVTDKVMKYYVFPTGLVQYNFRWGSDTVQSAKPNGETLTSQEVLATFRFVLNHFENTGKVDMFANGIEVHKLDDTDRGIHQTVNDLW